jgi:hypothetical protein
VPVITADENAEMTDVVSAFLRPFEMPLALRSGIASAAVSGQAAPEITVKVGVFPHLFLFLH